MTVKKILLLFLFSIAWAPISAQELNARVQLLAPTVSNISKRNLDRLQLVIRDFLNNNKWTIETYLQQERIDCNFVITITAWDGGSAYQADAQIQSSRPVFGTSYNSTLLNLSDGDFDFSYNEGQSLEFSEQNYISNLSSLLAFYAYTVVGIDKDSFGRLGGSPHYIKAQNTLNITQTSGNAGWKAADGQRNRYWLNENLLNKSFEPLRAFIYNFHRGMDQLQGDSPLAEKLLLSGLSDLGAVDKQKFGSYLPNVFFGTKATEIVSVFSTFNVPVKTRAYETLVEIDPANVSKYEALKRH
jgi:hypothetical protein